jgi:hypothetical protein
MRTAGSNAGGQSCRLGDRGNSRRPALRGEVRSVDTSGCGSVLRLNRSMWSKPMSIPPVRVLEVFVALAYGAIIGSHLPLPPPARVIALTPVAALPLARDTEISGTPPTASFGVSVMEPRGQRSVASEEPRTREPTPLGSPPALDTLPAAPLLTIPSQEPPRSGDPRPSDRPGRSTVCIGVDGAGEVCGSTPARARSHCPPDGAQRPGGTILCIREEG